MITSLHDRAIGQILALDNTPLGTGFLIAADGKHGKVLTAGHVVKGCKTVKIRFDKAGGLEITSKEIVRGDHERGDHDWALLVIDAPQGVEPLALYTLPFMTPTVRWSTIGYPKLVAHTRASFHGDVRIAGADELDLHCMELPAGAPAEAAAGLSGAPCLIDGGVAGILRDALRIGKQDPKNPTAAVFALPSSIIAREAGLPYVDGTTPSSLPGELPYELFFTGTVENWKPAKRRIAAGHAKLDWKVTYPPEVIARRMINEGIDVIGNVLVGVGALAAECEQLIDLAETLWINGQSALHMDAVLELKETALLLTDSDVSTTHHLMRALACRQGGRPLWKCVHIGDIYQDLDVVVAEVEARLRATYGDLSSAGLKAQIDSDDAHGRCPTVFLHGSPRGELTQRLKTTWKKLRIVYFLRAESATGEFPDIPMIAPVHTEDDEKAALDKRVRWRSELKLTPGGGSR